jgi:hypothetical protein
VASVSFCENSTISEAWALAVGDPAEARTEAVNATINAICAERPELSGDPTFVWAQGDDSALPPHYRAQLRWADGARVARVGHQYLAVHFLSSGGKYETFEKSLRPDLEWWLARWLGSSAKFVPSRVVFGYVNSFEFSDRDFALSDYFRAAIELRGKLAGHSQSGCEATFRLAADDGGLVHLAVQVDQVNAGSNAAPTEIWRVVVKTVANRTCAETAVDGILREFVSAKTLAKDTFFEFARARTHELMKARY